MGIEYNLYKVLGGFWGGNQINKVFMELLVKFFGEFMIWDFCKENMVDFFNIYKKIEVNKRCIFMNKDKIVKIDILVILVEKFVEMY